MTNHLSDKVSFSYAFNVKSIHLDNLDHVNNVVYLQWVQEASEKHWNLLANNIIKTANVWVALRHEIDYLSQAFLGDQITITTWIDSSSGAKSIRKVAIYSEGKQLVKCKTTWVLLDKQTLKPKRLTKEILDLFIKKET